MTFVLMIWSAKSFEKVLSMIVGVIGGTSHSIMPETPLDNIIALYEAFLEYQ